MKLLIHYKKQTPMDEKLLMLNIYYWTRYFKEIDDVAIVGRYRDEEFARLKDLKLERVFNRAMRDRGDDSQIGDVCILSFKDIEFKEKFKIINHQLLRAIKELGIRNEEFISSHIDVFPVKEIDRGDLNKEYIIKGMYKRFNPKYDFEILQKRAAKWYKEKFNLRDIRIYDGHIFNLITPELITHITTNKLENKFPYTMANTYYNEVIKDENVFKRGLINTTFANNKYVWDDSMDYKGVNITMPTRYESMALITDLIKPILDIVFE